MVLGNNLNGKVILFYVDVGIAAHSLHQSALNLGTSVISMVQNAELGVSSLSMKVEVAIAFLIEIHAPVNKFADLFWSHTYNLFYGLWIADVIASNHCVFYMFLEVV